MTWLLWVVIIVLILSVSDKGSETGELRDKIKKLEKRIVELDMSTVKIVDVVKKGVKNRKKKRGRPKKTGQ